MAGWEGLNTYLNLRGSCGTSNNGQAKVTLQDLVVGNVGAQHLRVREHSGVGEG